MPDFQSKVALHQNISQETMRKAVSQACEPEATDSLQKKRMCGIYSVNLKINWTSL